MLLSRAIDDACVELGRQGVAVPNYHGAREVRRRCTPASAFLLDPRTTCSTTIGRSRPCWPRESALEELMGDLLMNSRGTSLGHGGIMHVTAPRTGHRRSQRRLRQQVRDRPGTRAGGRPQSARGRGRLHVRRGGRQPRRSLRGHERRRAAQAPRPLPRREQRVRRRRDDGPAVQHRRHVRSGQRVPHAGGQDRRQRRGAVADQVADLTAAARSGAGPAYLECVTARLDPHHAHGRPVEVPRSRYAGGRMAARAARSRTRRLLRSGRTDRGAGAGAHQATEPSGRGCPSRDRRTCGLMDVVYSHTYYEGHGVTR